MTISVTQSKVVYNGNGSTSTWDIPFPFLSKNDLKVYRVNAQGMSSLLQSGYTVHEDTHVLTYPIAGNETDILTSDEKLVILRSTPQVQEIGFNAQDALDPSVLELGYDKAMMIAQELKEQMGRSLQWGPADDFSGDPSSYLIQAQQAAVQAQSAWDNIEQTIDSKQDVLTAGEGIVIENNVISAPDGTPFTQSGHISNCITTVARDISLALSSGVLTLQKGSVLYIPAGFEEDGTTLKFTSVTTQADSAMSAWGTDEQIFVFGDANGDVNRMSVSRCFSGSTAPSSPANHSVWYDTTHNLIKQYDSDASEWSDAGYSFPIALVTNASSAVTSIDKIFNGFGYIGSTVFALPGVQGLIPNGRYSDGSLKNTTFTLQAVKTLSFANTDNARRVITLSAEGLLDAPQDTVYHAADNYNKNSSGAVQSIVQCGILRTSAGVIVAFGAKTIFHATEVAETASAGMSSGKYMELTVGASGSSYTAPATGWLVVTATSTDSNQYVEVSSSTLAYKVYAPASAESLKLSVPVKQGDLATLSYSTGTISDLKFVFAEGTKWEG